jgi:very-short-patch-repair endonuclease
VPRRRHLAPADVVGVHVTYRDLAAEDVQDGVTAPLRTVLDCLTRLPFDEGLAVADSALRSLAVRPDELQSAIRALRGPGATRAREVAAFADGRSANPFESVLRSICREVRGLEVSSQYQIAHDGIWAIVDLADPRLRLVVEAEGFEFHGTRRGLVRDCHRYTEITVLGWSVLRFTWEDVMYDPDWVRWAITAWIAGREGRPLPPLRTVKQAVAV